MNVTEQPKSVASGSLERAGSAATCEWETVAPAKICGEPAAYEDINGKKFCERHGHHLVKRYPTTMTKLEVPPNAGAMRQPPETT